jgi:hypothetical protein
LQVRLLYLAIISFITEWEIKTFCDKQKQEFMTTTLELQKILKEILHREEEDKCNHENIPKNKFH